MMAVAERFVDVGALDDIPELGARIVRVPNGCVAIFRGYSNRVFALDDRCPHKGGPLSQGIVHGASVTCPLHNLVIDLETGAALGVDGGHVRRFEIHVENGRLLLDPAAIVAPNAA
jgi:nitrite reductase [NAD(P)H] small subunit